MNRTIEDHAPWSRAQRQAVLGVPLSLVVGLLMAGKAIVGPFGLPLWIALVVAVSVLLGTIGMFVVKAHTESPDERDCQIMLAATRRAFVFLVIALMLPGAVRDLFTNAPPSWDAERMAMGLAMLSLSVYFGSILLLYRSPARR